jgi:predicted RNase H-like HicB family nuclease
MSIFGKQPVLVEIRARVRWQVAQDVTDGHWFGVCPDLNVSAAGDSWTEFQECASEAMSLLFQNLFKRGEMEGFLRRHGWTTNRPLPEPGTRATFVVPYGIEHRDRVRDLATA